MVSTMHSSKVVQARVAAIINLVDCIWMQPKTSKQLVLFCLHDLSQLKNLTKDS